MHNFEQAEKELEEAKTLASVEAVDDENNEEDENEDDEEAYDSGSGIPSALTPPDSPPFQVS